MDWQTTSTILEQLRDFGNKRAWNDFATRFRGPIVAFARKTGLNEVEADDVAQETLIQFAAALREQKYERAKGRLSRWLFGIAYRQALNARRRGAVHAAQAMQENSGFAIGIVDEQTLSQSWDDEWESCLLAQCLAHVRGEVEDVTYQAFSLVVQQGLSPTDAANALGIPVKAVYNAKHRVLARLRKLREALDDR